MAITFQATVGVTWHMAKHDRPWLPWMPGHNLNLSYKIVNATTGQRHLTVPSNVVMLHQNQNLHHQLYWPSMFVLRHFYTVTKTVVCCCYCLACPFMRLTLVPHQCFWPEWLQNNRPREFIGINSHFRHSIHFTGTPLQSVFIPWKPLRAFLTTPPSRAMTRLFPNQGQEL